MQDADGGVNRGSMLEKSSVDRELARRLCAAFVSEQMGVTVAIQYKKTPEDVGDLWYFLAALTKELARANIGHSAPPGDCHTYDPCRRSAALRVRALGSLMVSLRARYNGRDG